MKVIVGDLLEATEKVLFFVENICTTKLSGQSGHLADAIVNKWGYANPFINRVCMEGVHNMATEETRPIVGSVEVKVPPNFHYSTDPLRQAGTNTTDPIIGVIMGN